MSKKHDNKKPSIFVSYQESLKAIWADKLKRKSAEEIITA